ncbi:MAG: isoaspartyl peptidase/L-asparaginase family protein [Solirubrobacteraceae bacterium]
MRADCQFSLAIHGGAGALSPSSLTPELEAGYRTGLAAALTAGWRLLVGGGSAVGAVTQAVVVLEDNPLFNAGRGAVFTSSGEVQLDAAVMDGLDRSAGAVAAVVGPRNPVLAARAVMEHSDAVLLAGEGAVSFCRAQGIAFENPDYFYTERRWEALRRELQRRERGGPDDRDDADRHGTVGAVARDCHGNLAAATSTGGLTAKAPGRVGDSPVFGAGTWAENGTCAISATGAGEVFIRYGAAHEIAARVRIGGQTLAKAAEDVVAELLEASGDGGLVAVDATGRVAMPFNCQGMYRGVIGADGIARTAIYREGLTIIARSAPAGR